MIDDTDEIYKLVLLGDGAVGKTRLIERYVKAKYTSKYNMTEGVDAYIVSVTVGNGITVKVQISDWAGQPSFKGKRSMFYHRVAMALLVFDLTRPMTLQRLKSFWLPEVEFNIPPASRNFEPINSILVGNKADLEDERVITPEEGLAAVDDLETPRFSIVGYVEASAKEDLHVSMAFENLISRFAEVHLNY